MSTHVDPIKQAAARRAERLGLARKPAPPPRTAPFGAPDFGSDGGSDIGPDFGSEAAAAPDPSAPPLRAAARLGAAPAPGPPLGEDRFEPAAPPAVRRRRRAGRVPKGILALALAGFGFALGVGWSAMRSAQPAAELALIALPRSSPSVIAPTPGAIPAAAGLPITDPRPAALTQPRFLAGAQTVVAALPGFRPAPSLDAAPPAAIAADPGPAVAVPPPAEAAALDPAAAAAPLSGAAALDPPLAVAPSALPSPAIAAAPDAAAAPPAQSGPAPVPADAGPAAQLAPVDPADLEAGLALTRERKRMTQRRLAALGFAPGPADGRFGPRTRAAIALWQTRSGHAATGMLTPATLAALEAETSGIDVATHPAPRSPRVSVAPKLAPRPTPPAAEPAGCRRAPSGRIIEGQGIACDLDYLREALFGAASPG